MAVPFVRVLLLTRFPRKFLRDAANEHGEVNSPLRVWKLLDRLIPWIGRNDKQELYNVEPGTPGAARVQAWIARGQTERDKHAIVPFQLLDGTQTNIPFEAFIDASRKIMRY